MKLVEQQYHGCTLEEKHVKLKETFKRIQMPTSKFIGSLRLIPILSWGKDALAAHSTHVTTQLHLGQGFATCSVL